MWQVAAILFTSLTIVTLAAIELARSIVHRRRERRDGIGGTQDVAMVGVGLASVFALVAIVSLIMHAGPQPVVAAPPSTQPISTTAPSPRPADHLDVIEVVVRDLIVTYAPTADKNAEYVFLALAGTHDPPTQLMDRLRDDDRVVPLSKAVRRSAPVAHVDGTGHGVVVGVSTIAWLSEHTAEVTGGWFLAPLAAGGNTYRLEKRDGKWVITHEEQEWIS